MNNNERFNQLLNSCQHPRAVYNGLQALAFAPEEGRLLDMIRSSKDPGKAVEVDIGVIMEFLGGSQP